ncbi:MAG: hypothetical protein ACE366_25890 [Bradymonadia bacterium]
MASRIHYDQVPLDQLVGHSSLIVVAHRADPTRVKLEVPVPGTPAVEAFVRHDDRWVIDEVIHTTLSGTVPAKGETLQVASGVWTDMYDLHIRYHREGIRKSPIFPAYTPSAPVKWEAPAILFLRQGNFQGQGFWQYAVEDAMEPLSGRAAIDALLGKGKAAVPGKPRKPAPTKPAPKTPQPKP